MSTDFFDINFNSQTGLTSMPLFHYHGQWELYYLLEGARTYEIGNKVFNLNKGTFIIIPPYVSHRTMGGQFKRILALIDDNMLNIDVKRKILQTKSHFFVPSCEVSALLKNQFIYLAEHGKGAKLDKIDITIEINSIISKLLNHSEIIRQENITAILSKNAQVVNDIKQYISLNFGEKLSIIEISELCNLSSSRASHIFKEVEGISITTYINHIRLNRVQELLASTKKGLSEIAEECGLTSMVYLNQVFKRRFGITPMQYKRQNRY